MNLPAINFAPLGDGKLCVSAWPGRPDAANGLRNFPRRGRDFRQMLLSAMRQHDSFSTGWYAVQPSSSYDSRMFKVKGNLYRMALITTMPGNTNVACRAGIGHHLPSTDFAPHKLKEIYTSRVPRIFNLANDGALSLLCLGTVAGATAFLHGLTKIFDESFAEQTKLLDSMRSLRY